jgi:hypothetical protein
MAAKKKARRPKSSTRHKPAKAVRRETASATSADARIQALENRVKALEQNPVLALSTVLELEGAASACKTVRIKGNLQIVNGLGRTNTTNGCGNLIIGYNEPPPSSSGWPGTRTGSHNLILGRFHSHASYAGLLSGEMNLTSASAPSACVAGGSEGSANADRVVIVGGKEAKGNAAQAVIIGGFDNGANPPGGSSVVIGGVNNRAEGSSSCIFGGGHNTTNSTAPGSTILGGNSLATTTPGERIPP